MKDHDVWMVSDGLNIDLQDTVEDDYIIVCYGELKGTFKSLESKKNKLTFETNDIELALSYIKKSPTNALITYSNFSHKLDWDNHNYSIKKISKFSLLVTVEEQNE